MYKLYINIIIILLSYLGLHPGFLEAKAYRYKYT